MSLLFLFHVKMFQIYRVVEYCDAIELSNIIDVLKKERAFKHLRSVKFDESLPSQIKTEVS